MIAFFNLPDDSPFDDTDAKARIDPSNINLAIFGSFLLGLGDACYNTQIFSFLGSVFKDDSAAGFAIFKFAQSAFAAAAFFYSKEVTLPWQLLFLAILCVSGTGTFCYVELQVRRSDRNQPYLVSSPQNTSNEEQDNTCGIATNEPEPEKA